MQISRLHLKNFKSFRGETDFDFSGTTSKKSIVLIGGMNGAGKTSIIEAIDLCLYGEANKHEVYKRINRRELQSGNVNLTVELEFINDDNITFIVRRNWSSKKAFNDVTPSDLEENLQVVRNGDLQSFTQESWQDFISTTIPRGIIKFFFFDGEKVHELAEMDKVGTQLRRDLEQVLGIELVRQLIDDLQKIRNEFIKNSNSISEADMEKVNNDFEYTQKKLDEIVLSKQEEQQLQTKYQNEIFQIEEKIHAFLGFNPELLSKHNELISAKSDQEIRQRILATQIQEKLENLLPYIMLQPFFSKIRHQIETEKSEKQSFIIQQKASDVAQQIVDKVLIPNFSIKKESHDELVKQIVMIISGKQDLKNKIIFDLSESMEQQLLSLLLQYETSYGKGLVSLIDQKQDYEQSIQELNKEIDRTSLPTTDKVKYDELQKQYKEGISLESRSREKIAQYDDEIFELEQQQEQLQSQMDQLADTFEGTKDQKDKIKIYGNYIAALENYVHELKRSKIQELRSHILEMYRKLAYKKELIGDIDVDELTYNISVTDQLGKNVDYRGSEGEKEVFMISVLWGLAQCTDFKLPIIIDTPLARLDGYHRSRMTDEYFPNASQQVIILSTDEEIAPHSTYYEKLEPYITREMTLKFDVEEEKSTIREGYFQ